MNITQDSQGSDVLQQDTHDPLGLMHIHQDGQHMMNSTDMDDDGRGVMMETGGAATDHDRSSSFSSDRPVVTNVSPLYHQAQLQHAAAMKEAGGLMASPMDGGVTGISAISTTPGGFTAAGTVPTATPISVVSSNPMVGSTPVQRSYVTTTPQAYQVPVGNYNAPTIMQGQPTFMPTGVHQAYTPVGTVAQSFVHSQQQHTVAPYASSSVSLKQSQPVIKYTPASTSLTPNTSGFMYQNHAQSSVSTKTGLLTQGTYFSTNPETPLSTSLVTSEMYTSRLHKTGSRTGRWITNFEGHTVEGKLQTGDLRVVGERIVEFEVKVPKKVVREEQWEKVIVIPEKQIKEDIIEDVQVVREKIVEYAKHQVERVVEVPEIQYVERIVEVAQRQIQEKIVHVPKVEVHERIVEVPRYVDQEKIVEVAEIEYKEVLFEKTVEVPEYREEVVVREVPVPQYVDKPVPEYVDVAEKVMVERNIPVPVAADTIWKLYLPKMKPRFTTEKIPLYVPRFIELPVPVALLTDARELEARQLAERVALIAQQPAISLCEVENVAAAIKSANFQGVVENADFFDGIKRGWKAKSVDVRKADPHKRPPSSKGSNTRSLASRTRDMRTRPPLPPSPPKRVDRSNDVFQSLAQQKGPSSRRSSNRRPSGSRGYAYDPNAQQRRDQAIALLNHIQTQ